MRINETRWVRPLEQGLENNKCRIRAGHYYLATEPIHTPRHKMSAPEGRDCPPRITAVPGTQQRCAGQKDEGQRCRAGGLPASQQNAGLGGPGADEKAQTEPLPSSFEPRRPHLPAQPPQTSDCTSLGLYNRPHNNSLLPGLLCQSPTAAGTNYPKLQTTQTYYLRAAEVRSPNWVSLG